MLLLILPSAITSAILILLVYKKIEDIIKLLNSKLSLKKLLIKKQFPKNESELADKKLKQLQLQMLRIQQSVWHSKSRVIILFEGFDASGKGSSIRRIVEQLDPRSVKVFPFGPPTDEEKGKHYLYRFWKSLPDPGCISIFDRSWYGRVLVEKVDKLIETKRVEDAYEEINFTEEMFLNDGIAIIKIFLAISPDEQKKRFEERLKDPYKRWKLTEADVRARKQWNEYVKAVDIMFKKTNTALNPWHLIPADHKNYARIKTLEIITEKLKGHRLWIEKSVKLP